MTLNELCCAKMYDIIPTLDKIWSGLSMGKKLLLLKSKIIAKEGTHYFVTSKTQIKAR